ncbi:MAG TPA: 2-phosphosulfolactate phosphatase [bacterium]|nr:2-phosphosulfolactate phosphatase [bacterium]
MTSAERSVRVLASPAALDELEIQDHLVVVVDVLRACTAIAHALDAGARSVIPVETVEEATELAGRLGRSSAVLAGERRSLRIDGFDLGNSPGEFVPARVGQKTVVLTTSNGTRTFKRASKAKECVAGAIVNRSAVVRRAGRFERTTIVCAGDSGGFSYEDFLGAGLLVEAIVREASGPIRLHDGARAAREVAAGIADLPGALRGTDHGRELEALGFGEDLGLAASLDRFERVPALRDGGLTAEEP